MIIFAICMAAIAMALKLTKRAYGDYLSPVMIFGSIWLAGIGLLSLNLVEYIPISANIWLMFGASMLTFSFGFVLASNVSAFRDRSAEFFEARAQKLQESLLLLKVPIVWMSIFGLAGFCAYIFILNEYIGLEAIYMLRLDVIRATQSMSDEFSSRFSIFRSLNYLNIALVPMAAIYLRAYRDKFHKLDKSVLMLALLSFATTLLSADRTQPFTALIWTGLSLHYLSPHKTPLWKLTRNGALAIVVLLGIFIGIGQLTGKTFDNASGIQSYANVDSTWGPVLMPYVYLTGSFPGFEKYVEAQEDLSMGAFILSQPARMLNTLIKTEIEIPAEVGTFYRIPFEFNTYTYLNVFYRDFGLPGVILMPFLIGLMIGVLYKKSHNAPRVFTLTFLSLCTYCMVQSVFTNKFISAFFLEFTVVLFIVDRYVYLRAKRQVAQALPGPFVSEQRLGGG